MFKSERPKIYNFLAEPSVMKQFTKTADAQGLTKSALLRLLVTREIKRAVKEAKELAPATN